VAARDWKQVLLPDTAGTGYLARAVDAATLYPVTVTWYSMLTVLEQTIAAAAKLLRQRAFIQL
jgi:hypothetical protein